MLMTQAMTAEHMCPQSAGREKLISCRVKCAWWRWYEGNDVPRPLRHKVGYCGAIPAPSAFNLPGYRETLLTAIYNPSPEQIARREKEQREITRKIFGGGSKESGSTETPNSTPAGAPF